MSDPTLRALISGLLIAAATLFAIGVAIERNDLHGEHSPTPRAAAPAVLLLADADQGHESGAANSPGSSSQPTTEPSQTPTKRSGRETASQRAREGNTDRAGESTAQIAHERRSERIFGINPDSIALVSIAVAVSLALAAAVWLLPGIYAPLTIAVFAVGAAVFDIREVAHQINEHRTNLIMIATAVATLHLAAAASAMLLARNRRTNVPAAQPDLSSA